MLCRNNRKRPYDKEQAIPLLSANKKLPAYGRQNPADRKNFYSNLSRHHYSRSFTHVPDDALSSPVILNGVENALKERREAGTATARLNFTCRNIFPHAALSAFISFLYAVAEIHFFNYTFHNSDVDIKRSIFLVFIVFF